jgi:hypothetical protein
VTLGARFARRAAPLLAALPLAGSVWAGQVEVRSELRGRVLLADGALPGAQVVLHRVSDDSAGEVDSVLAAADGTFRFDLPALPDPGAGGVIYFASVRHDGILYFGPALSRPIQLDSLYTVTTYDTVSAPAQGAPLPVGVRYLILEPEDAGRWRVTDLFEIEVQAGGTLVAREGGVTWSHPLPRGAEGVELGEDPSGPRVVEGRLTTTAPLQPGMRQLVVRYVVDGLDGLRIPFAAATEEIELLVREPVPPLEVAGLVAIESVEMEEGIVYRRYSGTLPADTAVVLRAGAGPRRLPLEWLVVIVALVLAGAGLFAVRRPRPDAAAAAAVPGGAAPTVPPPDARDRTLLEIARLDERLEQQDTSAGERRSLEARRAELVRRLRDAR